MAWILLGIVLASNMEFWPKVLPVGILTIISSIIIIFKPMLNVNSFIKWFLIPQENREGSSHLLDIDYDLGTCSPISPCPILCCFWHFGDWDLEIWWVPDNGAGVWAQDCPSVQASMLPDPHSCFLGAKGSLSSELQLYVISNSVGAFSFVLL